MAEGAKTKGRADLVAHQRALRVLASRHAAEFEDLLDAERVGLGLPPRRPRRRVEVDAQLVSAMYETMTIGEVAAELGVSRETVRRQLHDLGVEVRPVGSRPAICA
jgi:DNA-binding NtrC family response regulator